MTPYIKALVESAGGLPVHCLSNKYSQIKQEHAQVSLPLPILRCLLSVTRLPNLEYLNAYPLEPHTDLHSYWTDH